MPKLRLFHYVTRLSVCWLRGQEILITLPENFSIGGYTDWTASTLTKQLDLESIVSDRAILQETPLKEQFLVVCIDKEEWVVCGPWYEAVMEPQDVRRLIRELHLSLNREEPLRAHFASLPHLTPMHTYYTSLLLEDLLRQKPFTPAPPVQLPSTEQLSSDYYHNAYQNRMKRFRHPPYFFEQEISRQIASGNREHALQLLGELNTLQRARLADSPLRSLKNSLIASVTLFTRAAINGGVPFDEAFTMSDSYIQLIERQQDFSFLSAIEEVIVLRFTDSVSRCQQQRYSQLIRKTIDLIDEYLTEPLNPAFLASRVYVHPDYLSSRFHREVGETLHHFILRRRVEESAHFMRYSNESIINIAAFYRFSSQSHFINVFKKIMGITPKKYREQ